MCRIIINVWRPENAICPEPRPLLFISIGQMPFLVPTLDKADLLFALVIPPGFYLHYVEVTEHAPASRSL